MCLLTLFAKLKSSRKFSISQYLLLLMRWNDAIFTFKNIELYHGYVVHGALAMTDNQTWSNNCIGFSYLTHLCRMYFPILINWTSPFPILGLLGGIFHFHSNFKRNFCKQTVENLIRRRVLRRLIWFCTVCQRPTKKTLGLYG